MSYHKASHDNTLRKTNFLNAVANVILKSSCWLSARIPSAKACATPQLGWRGRITRSSPGSTLTQRPSWR